MPDKLPDKLIEVESLTAFQKSQDENLTHLSLEGYMGLIWMSAHWSALMWWTKWLVSMLYNLMTTSLFLSDRAS